MEDRTGNLKRYEYKNLDWFEANYEQKLFRRRINQLFKSGYTNKEVAALTGHSVGAVEHLYKMSMKNASVCPQVES